MLHLDLIPDVDARCYHIMLTCASCYISADKNASFYIVYANRCKLLDICWQTQVFIHIYWRAAVFVNKGTHFSWLAEIIRCFLLFWNLVGAQPESIKWSIEDQALSKSHDLAPYPPLPWAKSYEDRESLVLYNSFNTLRCTTYQLILPCLQDWWWSGSDRLARQIDTTQVATKIQLTQPR